jgi:DNA-binding GntR family transcriptional regulator
VDVPETKYRKGDWLNSTEICEYLGEPKQRSRPIGKALTKLAGEGLIEERVNRGKKQYWLVVITERDT